MLQEFDVGYVFVGDAERALGFDFAHLPPNLTEVYSEGEVDVYKVGLDPSEGGCAPFTEASVPVTAADSFIRVEVPVVW